MVQPASLDEPIVSPELIGRAPQLAALDLCLGRAAVGEGQVVLVSGEAGIGKSRLVAEIRGRALARGFQVIQGACFETDRGLPYAPFIDLLRDLASRTDASNAFDVPLADLLGLPTHSPDADADSTRHTVAFAFRQLTRELAARQPLLMVLEDLHWSDDRSAELALHVARAARTANIALLLTYRSDELPPVLATLLARLDRERLAAELQVLPLSRPEISALVTSALRLDRPPAPDFLDVLARFSEGNPFHLEEILRSLVSSGSLELRDGRWDRASVPELHVPRTVREAVEQRTKKLGQPALQTLQLASVVGRRFGFAFVQMLAAFDEAMLLEAIKELSGAGLIVEESADEFAFRHALTREAVYAGLLARERRTLHQRVADLIERVHGDAPDALDDHLDLASHYFDAQIWEKAFEFGLRAGQRALAIHAPLAAVDQFTRALAAAAHLTDAPPSDLLLARGQALDLLGDFDAARVDFEAALLAARAEGDDVVACRALLELAALWSARQHERAWSYTSAAVELATNLDDRGYQAESLNQRGCWHQTNRQPDRAAEDHHAALAIFEELGDRHGVALTLELLGEARHHAADPRTAAASIDQATPALREVDEWHGLIDALTLRILLGGAWGVDEALPGPVAHLQPDAGLELARSIGWRAGEASASSALALWLGFRGDYARALELAHDALRLAEEIEDHTRLAGARLALSALHLDLLAAPDARAHAQEAVRGARDLGAPLWIDLATALLACSAVAQHDLDFADAVLDRHSAPDRPLETLAGRMLAFARAELLLARRDGNSTLAALDDLQPSEPCVMPRRDLLRGHALTLLSRLDEAEAALLEARRGATLLGARGLGWRIDAALAHVYQRQRRTDSLDQTLSMLHATIAELAGAVPVAALREAFVAQALGMSPRQRGKSVRAQAKQASGGLTAREREVAVLLASGLSNRAIAERLVIGERTVETYVSSILNKLTFTSRAQIAAWAVQQGFLTPA